MHCDIDCNFKSGEHPLFSVFVFRTELGITPCSGLVDVPLPTDPVSFAKSEGKPNYSDRVSVRGYLVESCQDHDCRNAPWELASHQVWDFKRPRLSDFTSFSLHHFAVAFAHSNFISQRDCIRSTLIILKSVSSLRYFQFLILIIPAFSSKKTLHGSYNNPYKLLRKSCRKTRNWACQSRSEWNTATKSQKPHCVIHSHSRSDRSTD
jgi:hypothetical protein